MKTKNLAKLTPYDKNCQQRRHKSECPQIYSKYLQEGKNNIVLN